MPRVPSTEPLTDSMILQMLGEAHAAEQRAGYDAIEIGCTPQQVCDIEVGARCETIRSYLYQAGILAKAATGPTPEPWQDCGYQDVECWKRQLLAAGWTEKAATIWKSPEGSLHMGPFGAWKKMRAQASLTERNQ